MSLDIYHSKRLIIFCSVMLHSTTIGETSMTDLEALGLKHPDPCAWILPSSDNLPLFEDSEITGSHILSIAHQLQGGAGPGECDDSHWRDILLRYDSSGTISTILLQHYVIVSAIPLFPGIVSEL